MRTIIWWSIIRKNGFKDHGHTYSEWESPFARYHIEKLTGDADYEEMYQKASSLIEKGATPYLIERMT